MSNDDMKISPKNKSEGRHRHYIINDDSNNEVAGVRKIQPKRSHQNCGRDQAFSTGSESGRTAVTDSKARSTFDRQLSTRLVELQRRRTSQQYHHHRSHFVVLEFRIQELKRRSSAIGHHQHRNHFVSAIYSPVKNDQEVIAPASSLDRKTILSLDDSTTISKTSDAGLHLSMSDSHHPSANVEAAPCIPSCPSGKNLLGVTEGKSHDVPANHCNAMVHYSPIRGLYTPTAMFTEEFVQFPSSLTSFSSSSPSLLVLSQRHCHTTKILRNPKKQVLLSQNMKSVDAYQSQQLTRAPETFKQAIPTTCASETRKEGTFCCHKLPQNIPEWHHIRKSLSCPGYSAVPKQTLMSALVDCEFIQNDFTDDASAIASARRSIEEMKAFLAARNFKNQNGNVIGNANGHSTERSCGSTLSGQSDTLKTHDGKTKDGHFMSFALDDQMFLSAEREQGECASLASTPLSATSESLDSAVATVAARVQSSELECKAKDILTVKKQSGQKGSSMNARRKKTPHSSNCGKELKYTQTNTQVSRKDDDLGWKLLLCNQSHRGKLDVLGANIERYGSSVHSWSRGNTAEVSDHLTNSSSHDSYDLTGSGKPRQAKKKNKKQHLNKWYVRRDVGEEERKRNLFTCVSNSFWSMKVKVKHRSSNARDSLLTGARPNSEANMYMVFFDTVQNERPALEVVPEEDGLCDD